MKNQFFRILMALVALISGIVVAQEQSKVVQLGADNKIREISASAKYVAVKTVWQNTYRSTAHLFDMRGNKLMEKTASDGGWIAQVEPLDSLGYFLVAEPGHEGAEGEGPERVPAKKGIVKAYDIATGQEVWSINLYADGLRISPDGMYMVTAAAAPLESSGFSIVNLKSGVLVNPNLKVGGWFADWFDYERIIIAEPQREIDQEALAASRERSKGSREREAILDSLIHQRLRHSHDARIGKISEEERQQKSEPLTKAIDSLFQVKRAETPRVTHDRYPLVQIPAATKITVYNIRTGELESEKALYTSEQKPFMVSDAAGAAGAINVERETQNIYLFGYSRIRTDGRTDIKSRSLVVLNKEMDVLSLIPLEGLSLQRINVEDEFYLIAKGRSGTFVVDRNKGLEVAGQTLMTRQGAVNVNFNSPIYKMTIIPNVEVNEENSSLKFIF